MSETRSERVDLRMTPSAKRTLQQAAAAKHKTLSEFLLDSSLNAAFDALQKQVFVLDEKRWATFMKALDRPPATNLGLDKLLSHKPRWKR